MLSFTTDEIVRTLIAVLLRTDPWRYKFLCYRCLLALTLEQPSTANKEYEVRRAIERVFRQPGALAYLPSFPCAKCHDLAACISAK